MTVTGADLSESRRELGSAPRRIVREDDQCRVGGNDRGHAGEVVLDRQDPEVPEGLGRCDVVTSPDVHGRQTAFRKQPVDRRRRLVRGPEPTPKVGGDRLDQGPALEEQPVTPWPHPCRRSGTNRARRARRAVGRRRSGPAARTSGGTPVGQGDRRVSRPGEGERACDLPELVAETAETAEHPERHRRRPRRGVAAPARAGRGRSPSARSRARGALAEDPAPVHSK